MSSDSHHKGHPHHNQTGLSESQASHRAEKQFYRPTQYHNLGFHRTQCPRESEESDRVAKLPRQDPGTPYLHFRLLGSGSSLVLGERKACVEEVDRLRLFSSVDRDSVRSLRPKPVEASVCNR